MEKTMSKAPGTKQQAQSKQKNPESGGWKFYLVTIAISAPKEMHDTLNGIINDTIAEQGGIVPNNTDWPLADEELDSLLMVECYNVKCSLLPYYKDLERFGIVGGATPFLNKDMTAALFHTLKTIVGFIKDNTDRPMAVQNMITGIVKVFDKLPVWGLFFQILTLQGILVWLEHLDISEGDDGYNEGLELCKWVWGGLMEKETLFSFQQYGDNDLERLKPFCEYLLSTETGKAVQSCLFPNRQAMLNDEQAAFAQHNIMTDRAKKYFAKAIQAGFMEQAGNGYKWTFRNGLKAALCYFLMKIYSPDITDPKTIHYKALEKLFDVDRLDSALSAMLNAKNQQEWRGNIDSLFDD